jgi:riboflavin kinase/FMN adenylyltransferase
VKVLKKQDISLTRNSICGIGSFDGVHRGHQAIVEYMKTLAEGSEKIGIITFTPLPFFVLCSAPIITLTSNHEKEQLFKNLGVDFLYYIRFSHKFADMPPEDFVKQLLLSIAPSAVVVGENFHFGKGRKGSARLLQSLASDKFTVHIVPRLTEDGTISSTRIRELLLLGHVQAANSLLGRPYTLSGIVIKGKGKGTLLGFPTINIKIEKEKLLPLDGVYKVDVAVHGDMYPGAMFCHHGVVEVHILDFSGNLYRHKVFVLLLRRIRGVADFSDDASLKKAIERDVGRVRNGTI